MHDDQITACRVGHALRVSAASVAVVVPLAVLLRATPPTGGAG